jgi:uncharacterized protein
LRVKNVTPGTALVERGRVADNLRTRFLGWMGERALPAGDGMLITACTSVPSRFMSIPIDVVYCDRHDREIALDAAPKPWRSGSLHRRVHHVIELPARAARASGT